MKNYNFILVFILILLLSGCNAPYKSAKQPNIVFILVDDLGYSDVRYMGHKQGLNTPNIDKIARGNRSQTGPRWWALYVD